jgi:hypothetical protein
MRNRRLLVPLAVVGSLGIALVPALAEAATPAVAATAVDWSSFVRAHHFNFSSPASRSVYHRTAAARGSAVTPNPDMELYINGGQTSSHGVSLLVLPDGFSTGSATTTVDWGDGTTGTLTVDAADLYPYNPGQAPATGTSNINYLTGQTIPNLAIISTGTVADTQWNSTFQSDTLASAIYLGGHGTADLVLDELGVYAQ